MSQYEIFLIPIFGAIIGYITNSIAVKMLFHPHKQIKLGKFAVPFTPGMIPKRQKDLAKAMGKMVETNLLTIDDMQERLLSPAVKNVIVEKICCEIFALTDKSTIEKLLIDVSDKTSYEGLKNNITGYLCDRIILAIADIELADIINKEGSHAIRKGLGGLLSIMISDSNIASLSFSIQEKIKGYLFEHGHELLGPIISDEIEILAGQNTTEAILSMGFSKERCQSILQSVYEVAISRNFKDLLSAIGISNIVEEKIVAMNISELEKLILSIMKTELETIINLGALIGFVLGLFSMLF